MNYNPEKHFLGGFTTNDGTIDFYLRINSLINKDSTILDFGAGRAAWYEDDDNFTRKNLRLMKGKVKKVIAADVDHSVLNNKTSDEQILISKNILKLPKNSIDLVIADYVLEHIEHPKKFYLQINSCLKKGGWLCARTPHKYSYVSIGSSFLNKMKLEMLIKYIQPNRKKEDIFPTFYKLNTLQDINGYFNKWINKTFIFKSDPGYFFGNKYIYYLQKGFHTVFPAFFSGNIFLFLQKT